MSGRDDIEQSRSAVGGFFTPARGRINQQASFPMGEIVVILWHEQMPAPVSKAPSSGDRGVNRAPATFFC
ncbi:MAG TPA: hypothetical protein PLL88_01435 [Anaerolineaceae bacterium]|nr:hypothetical protein [Anaerolineaceae bacterium]